MKTTMKGVTTMAEQEKQPEQSDKSHILEHHVRIEKLEASVLFMRAELDALEEKRKLNQKMAVHMLYGAAIGLLFFIIITPKK